MKKRVSKMNDKELDDFLKKLSSSPEIPYIPQDWDKLEKILAKNRVAKPLNGYKWILLGSLLIVGFLFTTWMMATFSQFQAKVENTSQMVSSTLYSEKDILPGNKVKIPDLDLPITEISPGYEDQDSRLNPVSVSPKSQNIPTPNKTQKIEEPLVPQLIVNTHSKWKAFEEFNRIGPLDNNFKIQRNPIVQYNTQNKTQSRLIHKNKIALGLVVSPDFSAIQFNQIPPSGRSIGISMEYFISERWSIIGGAIHAKKTYRHGKGYWEGYNAAHQGLEGDCWILEVPVNVRYYPIKKVKDKWFVSSGLSSYFMMKEKYVLHFENYNGNSYSREVEINGNNQHFFGIWNIGLGYVRKVSEKFAVQAEPYYRLPLVGIGEGNLDLKSTGIFFGIKYYP